MWDPCVDPMHRPMLPTREGRLFIGVDGAIKHDLAAVVRMVITWRWPIIASGSRHQKSL
jgi:hypothetical protein